jgi:type I restriction enzyme, S subunit
MRESASPTIRIGDLGEVFTGRTPPTGHPAFFGDDYPFITPGDMHQGKYARATERSVSQKGAEHLKRIQVPANSVCVSCIGWQMGEVIMTDKPSFTNQQINTIVPNGKIEPSFLYYSLRPRKQELLALGATTGVRTPILNKSAFCDLKVSVPSLPVQRRIAAILSAYDDLIENNQRRIKILEEMARSIYREWFVNFRFPGHEKLPLVDSPLGPIPKGWEVLALEKVCSRITDGSHSSPGSVETGFPMASVKDMHDWGITLNTCRRISEVDYRNLLRNDCKPKKGDVLIAKDGSYLKRAFVVIEEQDLVILSSIAMLRPNSRIQSNYLNFVLRDPDTRSRMKGYVSGVALPRIILKDFRGFQIVVAPTPIQIQWSMHIDPMVTLCAKLIRENENLNRTRNLILPRLLSGEMAVAPTKN